MIYRFLLPLLAALPTSAFVSHTWITPQVIHFSPRHQQCRHYSSSISKETGIIVPSSVEDADKQKTRSLYFMQGLAFNSGFLNGIFLSGIFGRVQAVGPVTDSWTKNAVAFANGDVSRALFVVAVLLSFSMGAFTNGWINPQPELFDLSQRKKPLFLAWYAKFLFLLCHGQSLSNIAFYGYDDGFVYDTGAVSSREYFQTGENSHLLWFDRYVLAGWVFGNPMDKDHRTCCHLFGRILFLLSRVGDSFSISQKDCQSHSIRVVNFAYCQCKYNLHDSIMEKKSQW